MSCWTIAVGFSLCGAMIVMLGIGIAFSTFMPALDKWNRHYFIAFFSLLLMYAVVLTIDMIIYVDPDMGSWLRVIFFLEYLFFSVLTVMPMPFLLHCCGERIKSSPLMRSAAILWGVFFIFLCTTQFTDIFYHVLPDNQYTRTPLFPLMIAPLTAVMLLNTVTLFRRRQKFSKKVFTALVIYLMPMTILIIAYMAFADVEKFVSFWISLFEITMFQIILNDNLEQYTMQQREISHQRADIMVLQMRPHFIYNTMTTIYYLCKMDPDKAQQVTQEFITYLRQNFTAIASENTIPFSEELRHTQAYLTVEKAQHEDNLFMKFDTPHTVFRIPPLTLQPLVENAVKHGLDTNGKPLSISVTTRLTDKENEIIVEDNGPGYDPTYPLNPPA